MLKETLKPYAKYAKLALGLAALGLVVFGVYDAATVQALIGAAMAAGTAFWVWYDSLEDLKEDKE